MAAVRGSAAATDPREAHRPASGQASHSGARAVHVPDARSITASSHRPGSAAGDEIVGGRLEPGRWRRHAEDARDDTADVDVERGDRHAECRGRHGAGRVRTDPRQRLELRDRRRHAATVLRDDRPGGLAEGEGPPVVAKPGPCGQQIVRPGFGQVRGRRPAVDEPPPGRADPLDPRLLRHHLRDQHLPRVRGLADQQRTARACRASGTGAR